MERDERRIVEVITAITAINTFLHVYDWSLHFEDNFGWTVPWQPPYQPDGFLEFLTYTQHWTLYWGLASVLSIIALLLGIKLLS